MYECVLCPVKSTHVELLELPKTVGRKKSDRDKEKEKLEREWADRMLEEYRQHQKERGRPEIPREALKRTAENNWVHLKCAMWTPELRFASSSTMDIVEGIGVGPHLSRYDTVCKVCKNAGGDKYPCVQCHQCHAPFHVGCARADGYTFGFDVTPIKGSRRDSIATCTIGAETGSVTAAIWCKDHPVKTTVHPLSEDVGDGMIAMQMYCRNYKQADLTLTGTARKANLVEQSAKAFPTHVAVSVNRRASTTQGRTARNSIASVSDIKTEDIEITVPERRCAKCNIDVTPKWWPVDGPSPSKRPVRSPEIHSILNKPDQPVPTSEASLPDRPMQNGVHDGDHPMLDAALHKLAHDPGHGTGSAENGHRPSAYLCQKCHWKKLNAPEEPEKKPTPEVREPESRQQLPLRSPTLHPYAHPAAPALATQHPPPPPQQPPMPWAASAQPVQAHPAPVPTWAHPPPPAQVNGLRQSPQVVGPPLPPHAARPGLMHVSPPLGPDHRTNGFPHPPPIHDAPPFRAPYPPSQPPPGPPGPPPLRLSNSPMLGAVPNGLPSPHGPHYPPPFSPTHPPPPPHHIPLPHSGPTGASTQARHSESSFPPSAARPPFHGSPPPAPIAPTSNRPTTPRSSAPSLGGAPGTGSVPPELRPSGGASASPSLRNLLH